MTAAHLDDRRRHLSAIHAAASQLGLDTADKNPACEYRTLLHRVTGKHSTSVMDAQERAAVIRELQHLLGKRPRQGMPWQERKVRDLWAQLQQTGALEHTDDAALMAFVKKMTGTDAMRWLTVPQYQRVIEGLKAWLSRVQANAEAR